MKTITCNRLFVNDTDISDTLINKKIQAEADDKGIVVVNGRTLGGSIRELIEQKTAQVDKIFLPGSSYEILLRCIDWNPPPGKIVLLPSVTRKLEGLCPIGLTVNEDDQQNLAKISADANILILDDVVASGTTILGIMKNVKTQSIETISLVLRERNSLGNLESSVSAGCCVKGQSVRFPGINTLSSLVGQTEKGDRVLAGFKNQYGEGFVRGLREIFL